MKFLLVDDYQVDRWMLKRILEGLGYGDFAESDNGRDALDKIQTAIAEQKPFDLIFCDWNMPKMSGFDMLQACRSHDKIKTLPIIMVTLESEKTQVIKALKAGATDFIVKPVSQMALKKKLTSITEALSKAGVKTAS